MEVQVRAAAQVGDFLGKCVGGQGAGGDDRELIFMDARDLLAPDCDQRFTRDCFCYLSSEGYAIDGESMAGRYNANPSNFH